MYLHLFLQKCKIIFVNVVKLVKTTTNAKWQGKVIKAGFVQFLAKLKFECANKTFNSSNIFVTSGGSVDLYYRYGFFSLSVRVIPRDDAGSWLIREPTTGIFDESTVQTMVRPGPNSFAQQPFEVTMPHIWKYQYKLDICFLIGGWIVVDMVSFQKCVPFHDMLWSASWQFRKGSIFSQIKRSTHLLKARHIWSIFQKREIWIIVCLNMQHISVIP